MTLMFIKPFFCPMDWMHELSRDALGIILQPTVLHKKNSCCLAEEQWSHSWTSKSYQLPGSFSCWAHCTPYKGTSRQDRTTDTTTKLATAAGSRERLQMRGDSRLWEVRTRVKARASTNHSFPFPLLSSRKLAKPALPRLSPVILLMLLNRFEPVLRF